MIHPRIDVGQGGPLRGRTLQTNVCALAILMFACACLRVSRAQADSAARSATTTQCDQPATASGATSGDTSNKNPGDLYTQPMHPLQVVRGSLEKWSDAEL